MSSSGLSGNTKLGDRGSSGKSKFQPQNINSVFSGKSLIGSKAGGLVKHGLQSLGKQSVVTRRMPPPANLPSLRSESAGQDPNVNLVPSGGPGWGVSEQTSQAAASTPPSTNASSIVKGASGVTTGPASSVPSSAGGNSRGADLRPSWTRTAKEEGFYSAQSSRDFPSLAAAGNGKPATPGEAGGPSLRPQKHGSWKSGGKVGGDDVRGDGREEDVDGEGNDRGTPESPFYPPPPPPALQPRIGREGYPGFQPGMPPSAAPRGFPAPPFYGPGHRGGGGYPPNFSGPYPERHFDGPYSMNQPRPPHSGPYPLMDPRAQVRPPMSSRDYGGGGGGYYDYDMKNGSSPDDAHRNGNSERYYYGGREDYRGPDRDPGYYDSRFPPERYPPPPPNYHHQRGSVWSDGEEDVPRDRQPLRPRQTPDDRERYSRDRRSWGPDDNNYEAGEWDYERGDPRSRPPQQRYPTSAARMGPPLADHPREPYPPDWHSQPRLRGYPPDYPPSLVSKAGGNGAYSAVPSGEKRRGGARELRTIEAEEAEENRRQSQQAAEREAAIERSRQKRRLGQQASISSTGTAENADVNTLAAEMSYVSVDEEESDERPSSRDSLGRNAFRRRQANTMGQSVPPRFQKQMAETGKPERLTEPEERIRNRGQHDGANKWSSEKVSDRSGRKPKGEPKKADDTGRFDNERRHNEKTRSDSYSIEGPTLPATVKEDDLRFAASARAAAPLNEEEEEEEEQKMQVLTKPGTKVMKRTVGEGDHKKSEKKSSHNEQKGDKRQSDGKNQRKRNQDGKPLSNGQATAKGKGQSSSKSGAEEDAEPRVNVWEQRREKRESQEREAVVAPIPPTTNKDMGSWETHAQSNNTVDVPESEQFRNLDTEFNVQHPDRSEDVRMGEETRGGRGRGRSQREFISQSRRRGPSATAPPRGASATAYSRGGRPAAGTNRRGSSVTWNSGGGRRRNASGGQIDPQQFRREKEEEIEIGQWDNSEAADVAPGAEAAKEDGAKTEEGQRGRGRGGGARGTSNRPRRVGGHLGAGGSMPPAYNNFLPSNPNFYFPFVGPNPFLASNNRRGGARGGRGPPAPTVAPYSRGRRGAQRGRGSGSYQNEPPERGKRDVDTTEGEPEGENGRPKAKGPRSARRGQRRRSGGRGEKENTGASAKSPTQSEGHDEWETASESSDVAERASREEGEEGSRKRSPGNGPQRYSNQRRLVERGGKGRGQSTTWGPGSGPNRERDGKTDSAVGGTTGQKNVKIASLQERRSNNSRNVVGEHDRENTCKPDALAGVDLNDIASVIVIDDQPEVTNNGFEWGDFQEVLSKKEKRLRREQQILEEKKKGRSQRRSEKTAKKDQPDKDAKTFAGEVTMSTWETVAPEPKKGTVPAPIGPPSKAKPAKVEVPLSCFSEALSQPKETEAIQAFNTATILGWDVQTAGPPTSKALLSKTGVEIWGTPDPIPFCVKGDKNQKEIERPAPSKSVEFPADMNTESNGEPDIDFTFNPSLSSTEEGTEREFARKLHGEDVGKENQKLTEQLDKVKQLWKSSRGPGGGSVGDEEPDASTAAIVSSAVSLAVLKQKHDEAKSDGPQVAKVLPQQQQQLPPMVFAETKLPPPDYNYQNGNREPFPLDSPVLKLQPITHPSSNMMFNPSAAFSSASPPSMLSRLNQGGLDFSQPPPHIFNHPGGTLWSAQQPPPTFQNLFSPGLDIFGGGRQPNNPMGSGNYFIGSAPPPNPSQMQAGPGAKPGSMAAASPAMFQSNPPTAFLLHDGINTSPGMIGLASQPPPPLLAPIGSHRSGSMHQGSSHQAGPGQGNFFLATNPQPSAFGNSILGPPPPAQGPPMPQYNFQMGAGSGNIPLGGGYGGGMSRFQGPGGMKPPIPTPPPHHFNPAIGQPSLGVSNGGGILPFPRPPPPPGPRNHNRQRDGSKSLHSDGESSGGTRTPVDLRQREGNLLQQIDNFINEGESQTDKESAASALS